MFWFLDFSHLEIHRSTISREAFSQGLSVSSNPKISTYYLILPAPDNGKGRGQKKKRDYVGKIPKKIAEVIWEDCGGYMGFWFGIFPYNLRNLPI